MSVLQGPEFYISKRVGKAIHDYGMLADNDKVLVAVSGGKDSLALLKVLHDRKSFVPIKYDLLAVHVDMGLPSHHPEKLAQYFKKNKIAYHIEKVDILKGRSRKHLNCFWCSWNRRKALFETAARTGCTKVAFGHHHDDIVETMLLNLFFQGEISTMAPRQELFGGKITIIRPLAYVEEDMIVRFAKTLKFPYQTCACPQSATSNRTKMTQILKDLKHICPDVKKNIFRSLQRIKKDYLP
jgi:tRNA 2-thiocytidine biosynthesis protein TtcA